eukprot:jgi/Undpi1/7970/HiC_scaffold_24.g10442.m1
MSFARGGGGGAAPSVDQLRRMADLALRQVKKLRKYELEQVCVVAGLPTSGLKATLLNNIEAYLGRQFGQVMRSSGGVASHALELAAVAEEISMGYMDVLQKRPVAGTYSHHTAGKVKQDGGGFGQRALAPLARGGAGGGSSGAGGGAAPGWDGEAGKDVLRRSELDPFVEVSETVGGPAKLERGSGVRVSVSVAVVGFKLLKVALRRSGLGPFVEVTEDYQWPGEAGAWLRDGVVVGFNLSQPVMEATRRSLAADKSTPEGRKSHILLRAYKLNKNGSSGGVDRDLELGGHLWPLESVCQVNRSFQQLKQRKVFFQGTTRKLKGDCSPLDIGHACRLGENRVELYSSDPDCHAVVVQTVRLVGVDEVLRNIKQRSHLTKKEALRRVKRSFKGCLDLDVAAGSSEEEEEEEEDDGNGDSDDELMATCTRLSLRCPLGLVPITCPGRGRFCKHLQCFDLKTFLNFNKDCAGAAWKCGVCNMPLRPADLVVDTYLDEVVRTLEEQGLTNEAEEVEIHKDGHWDPILEDQKAGKSRRDRKKTQAAAAAASGGAQGGMSTSPDVIGVLENGGGNPEDSAVDLDGDDAVSVAVGGGAAVDSSPPPAAPGAPAEPAEPEHEVFDLSLDSDEDEEPPAPIAPPPAPRPVDNTLASAAVAAAASAAAAAAFRISDILSGASASEKARHPAPAAKNGDSSSGRQPLELPPPPAMDSANASAGRTSPATSVNVSGGDGGGSGGGARGEGSSAFDMNGDGGGGARLDAWERGVLAVSGGGEERGRGAGTAAHAQLGAPHLLWDNPLVAFSTGHSQMASLTPAGEGSGSGSGGGGGNGVTAACARRQGQDQGQGKQATVPSFNGVGNNSSSSSSNGVAAGGGGGGGAGAGGGYGQSHPAPPPLSPPPLSSPIMSALGSGSGSASVAAAAATGAAPSPALHPPNMHNCSPGFSTSSLGSTGGQGTAMRGLTNPWEGLDNQARLGSSGAAGRMGGSTIVGWESPAVPSGAGGGAGAGAGTHSLKRPRPGSSASDYQVSVEQEWAANANAELVDADTTTRAQTAPMLALIIIMRIGVKEGMFKILEARMLTDAIANDDSDTKILTLARAPVL